MNSKYEAILHTEWTGVRKHTKNSMEQRAAQFSPFAALSGYDDEIQETARLTDQRVDLTENRKEEIDRVLQEIQEDLYQGIRSDVSITYFKPDQSKEGGAYLTVGGSVRKLDPVSGRLTFAEGGEVPIREIIDIIRL